MLEYERYDDFKEFLQKNILISFKDYLHEYIDNEYHIDEQSDRYSILENLKVGALRCDSMYGDNFDMDIGVSCNVCFVDKATGWNLGTDCGKWYTIHTDVNFKDKLRIKARGIEKYKKNKPMRARSCSEFLVPYLTNDQMEELADGIISLIFGERWPKHGYRLPKRDLEIMLGLKIASAEMPEDCLGKIYFETTIDDSLPDDRFLFVKGGTAVINSNRKQTGEMSKESFIFAHEVAHWLLHWLYFKMRILLDKKTVSLSCEAEPVPYNENMSPAEKAHWHVERQANALAVKLNLPKMFFCYEYNSHRGIGYSPEEVEDALRYVSKFFDVSNFMAKRRARELGKEEADGVFVYVDGRWYAPFGFTKGVTGILDKDETFVINRKEHNELCKKDKEYAELIKSGKFVYLGYVTCINDPKYVTLGKVRCKKKYHSNGYCYSKIVTVPVLTDYARHHAEECCLKFTSSCKKTYNGRNDYYENGYLADELNASILTKKKCTDDLVNQTVKERAETERMLVKEGRDFMRILRNLPSSFSGTLNSLIEQNPFEDDDKKKKKLTNIELSIRTGFSEDYIARLRNDEKNSANINLRTVCALCIALHLPPCFSRDLLRKADRGFPKTEEGYIQERILENLYSEPLASVDELLMENGILPWGKTS